MIALDTNVLIRLIIFDDPIQSGIADDLIRNNRIFISKGSADGIRMGIAVSL